MTTIPSSRRSANTDKRFWRNSISICDATTQDHPDLDAYNEDARRRAVVLGFPPETFVIRRDQFPRDWKDNRDAEEKLAEPPSVERP